jgi:uncharacterized protein (TIGR02301 family)
MRALSLILLFVMLSASAAAQKPDDEREPTRQEQPVINAPRDVERTLPYLAYTLGELHYLAFACEGLEAQEWRRQMIELLSMETPNQGRQRDRLIEAFNDGYRVQQRYRPVCGPEVDAERRALALRGRDLSEMMRASYFD